MLFIKVLTSISIMFQNFTACIFQRNWFPEFWQLSLYDKCYAMLQFKTKSNSLWFNLLLKTIKYIYINKYSCHEKINYNVYLLQFLGCCRFNLREYSILHFFLSVLGTSFISFQGTLIFSVLTCGKFFSKIVLNFNSSSGDNSGL